MSSRCPLNHGFSLCPSVGASAQGPWCYLPTAGWSAGSGILVILCLLFYVVSFSFFLCRSCAVSPQFFFRRSCSFCRYRFDVFIGGGEFRIFLCCHLGLEFWLNVTVDSLKISPPSLLAFSFCGFQYFTVKLPIYSLLCIYAV